MQQGISLWSFVDFINKTISVKDLLTQYKNHNVPYVELLDYFLDGKENYDEIKKLLDQYGISVSSYSVSNEFVCCEDFDAEVERIKRGVDYANFFNAPVVRVFSGSLREGMSFDQAYDTIIKGFNNCVGYAQERNVTLALENHGRLAGKSSQLLQIINDVNSEALKLTVDTGNFVLVDEAPLIAIKAVINHIGHVHFKDFIKHESGKYRDTNGQTYQGTVLGKGSIPLADIISLLKENDYKGNVSIEYEGLGEDIEEVWESYAYLNSLI